MTRAPALLVLGALCGCVAEAPAGPRPAFWPLARLLAIAEEGGAYVAYEEAGEPKTVVPMRAVVTPPGQELFFRSPPFGPEPVTHTGTAPLLNVLPGLAAGRFTPYVTVELWRHDFGDVWVQPLYVFQKAGPGGELVSAGASVFSTDVTHRFYSPFWQVVFVRVPDAEVAAFEADPPTSVKDVLDLGPGYEFRDGPLSLCPLVPAELALDPALARDRDTPPVLGSVWDEVLRAEYTEAGLLTMSRPVVVKDGGWFEGRRVSFLRFGGGLYRELPGAVVEAVPIFMWFDRLPDGSPKPLGLPNVGAQSPLFSGRPTASPTPDWSAFWDLWLVERPGGAHPFFPGPALPGGVDRFAALRTAQAAPAPSAEVNALPGVERYAGRLALKPQCFQSVTPETSAAAWAGTCRFLDSQAAIEAAVPKAAFVDPKIRVLCPIVLWPAATEVRE